MGTIYWYLYSLYLHHKLVPPFTPLLPSVNTSTHSMGTIYCNCSGGQQGAGVGWKGREIDQEKVAAVTGMFHISWLPQIAMPHHGTSWRPIHVDL
ncbi:hypothetical protein RRG08_022362 [Elysia crispata]|uniref:Uncharacterized protein n=1 Tax=Elysia crispata TaxID=231223 RepID=A0AAE0Z118_9GAST|nr:hypothetical protein RRG08_022362 [Elysia crispata]